MSAQRQYAQNVTVDNGDQRLLIPTIPRYANQVPHSLQRSLAHKIMTTLHALMARLLIINDAALKNGVHLVAGPGTGKSRLLGRLLAWQLFVRRLPLVILDPTGGVIDNLIDKISRLPQVYRQQLWPRIAYVDLGATDYVMPSPLYYRQAADDTLFAIANRLLAVLKRQDPDLQSAPILGWNSLYECGLYAGQLAAALDAQIDFVVDLVTNPRPYKDLLTQALVSHPELSPAVTYFRELMDPGSGALRSRRTDSFRNKLIPFRADPTFLAAFAAPQRGIDWEQVVSQGQTVLIDARGELDPDRRQFKLLWWFRDFVDYIKSRDMAGRGQEVTFIIDEVTQLLGYRNVTGQSLLTEDLEELTAVLGRNYGVNVAISHQNLSQVEPRIQNILLQMGVQCIGALTNDEDAIAVARALHRYDPTMLRKREPVWMNFQQGFGRYPYSRPEIIDYTTTEFTVDEQVRLAADALRSLPQFTFLLRTAKGEGDFAQPVQRISIAHVDPNEYPDARLSQEVRSWLRAKSGVPVADLLAAMEQNRQARLATPATQRQRKAAILAKGKKRDEKATDHSDLSPTTGAAPCPAPPDESFKEELWTTP